MMSLESSLLDFIFYISFMNRKKTKILKGINNISGLCFSKCILRILKRPDIEINSVLIHLMMCATSHCWQAGHLCWA